MIRIDTTAEDLVPLATEALAQRVTREKVLRAAIRDGRAVQLAGRWFVRTNCQRDTKAGSAA